MTRMKKPQLPEGSTLDFYMPGQVMLRRTGTDEFINLSFDEFNFLVLRMHYYGYANPDGTIKYSDYPEEPDGYPDPEDDN